MGYKIFTPEVQNFLRYGWKLCPWLSVSNHRSRSRPMTVIVKTVIHGGNARHRYSLSMNLAAVCFLFQSRKYFCIFVFNTACYTRILMKTNSSISPSNNNARILRSFRWFAVIKSLFCDNLKYFNKMHSTDLMIEKRARKRVFVSVKHTQTHALSL